MFQDGYTDNGAADAGDNDDVDCKGDRDMKIEIDQNHPTRTHGHCQPRPASAQVVTPVPQSPCITTQAMRMHTCRAAPQWGPLLNIHTVLLWLIFRRGLVACPDKLRQMFADAP